VITRREFNRAALIGLVLPAWTARWDAASPVAGVRLGVQTYSFRGIATPGSPDTVDVIVDGMKACGLDECELWSPQIESPFERATPRTEHGTTRDVLRQWRLSTGPEFYDRVRRRFAAADMTIYAYNLSFDESFTREEINRGFEAARALGAQVITASTTLTVARRLVPFAETHRIPVAMHNHSRVADPNEFATPESFTMALAMSPLFRVNLDIGHFTAANFDSIAFLDAHHDRITNLHLKDRRKDQGDNVPWGRGDTPIRETLQWLRRHRSPVRAYVEYEYQGTRGVIREVAACADFARRALTG
jgi:sugar phosphate isomerase/epimerase